EEIYISHLGNFGERFLRLIQLDVFSYHVTIFEFDTFNKLFLTPTVEAIASAGFSFECGREFQRLTLEKFLRLFVVRVDHHRKIQTEASLYIFNSRRGKIPLRRTLDLARLQKDGNSLLQFVFPQLVCRWEPDRLRELL